MKILLIQPPKDQEAMTGLYPRGYAEKARSALPPLGLLSLAAFLKRRHEVHVLDMILLGHTEADLSDLLNTVKPDIVGVTAIIGLWLSALRIFRKVKSCHPSIRTVVGGPNATYYPLETLSHKEIDFLIVGNGEKPLMDLCDHLEAQKSGEGIENCYLQNSSYSRIDCVYSADYALDNFPFPDRTLVPYERYVVPFCPENPATTMITSVGCPFKCAFCTKARPPLQLRSMGLIVDEMVEIQRLGIRSILFQDELFTLTAKRVKTVCEDLIKRNVQLHWTIKARVDTIQPWMLELMKKAGCFNIHFGIESGNDVTLKRMEKGYCREQIKQTVEMVKKAGLSCSGNFMLAYPGETEDDILQSIEFARELNLNVSQFSLTIDSPGSKLFDEAVRVGRRSNDHWSEFVRDPDGSKQPLELFSASDRFSQSELHSFLEKAFASTRTLFDVKQT
jgi:anaerobic magnesium-protoporphyrin IX monomethyl ester cyclase